MNILVVGCGAREHAIGWALKKSKRVDKLFFAPGNAGTEQIGMNLPVSIGDNELLLDAAKTNNIELVVIGPESALSSGVVDCFNGSEIGIVGPHKSAVQLEGSKVWAKSFMERCKIPGATARAFSSVKLAKEYIKRRTFPVVIKADGLAEGKGVVIAQDSKDAEKVLDKFMVEETLGAAGKRILIEEYLEGTECSVFMLLDGKSYVVFGTARDYKKALDGDKGDNTGGMGAVAYPSLISVSEMKQIKEDILVPTFEGLRKEGLLYRGFLYVGLMLTKSGPKVLEYNVRLGDPETQVILPLLEDDLLELLWNTANGSLSGEEIRWKNNAACGVVVAKEGYPGKYSVGSHIPIFSDQLDLFCFQANTERKGNTIVNTGGRTLTVVAVGDTMESACNKVYEALDRTKISGYVFRRDIGTQLMAVLG